MTGYNLKHIIAWIENGELVEGDLFETASGWKAVYKNGALRWVTLGGYVGSTVAITEETIKEVFYFKSADPVRKLNEGSVYNIHHQYHFAKRPVAEIAEEKGVSQRMIYYILEGKRWADVYEIFHKDYDVVIDDYIA
ncbi:hypothetical protein [Neobacillus vireti]|uniref:hypothetical protein n=1 Tax=Neobacillus vireti TaxID=220686 RepID=UPI002FFF6A31